MKWSKQKKLLESLLADSMKDRLEFHITRYGQGLSWDMSRAWVTWDKKELVNFSNIVWYMQYAELSQQIREMNGSLDYKDPRQETEYYAASNQAKAIMEQRNVFARDNFLNALEEYFSLPVDAALEAENPIIRALAMVDRRVGKRRLAKMEFTEIEHPLVQQFYTLRCEAEGLKVPASPHFQHQLSKS